MMAGATDKVPDPALTPAGYPALSIDGVTVSYGRSRAVDGISLDIAAGSFLVLLGPSGCGKSTLLRAINGLAPLSAGRIRIGGRELGSLPVEETRRGIGYAIQSIGLFPHWTIARNIGAVPRLLGWDKARIAQRVLDLLDLMRLPRDLAEVFPHQLSGGQQQRVGVARALAADPPILLMDEPFGALDTLSRTAIQDELKQIHAETGKTIVFVTHDLDEAIKLGTHLALMEAGRLVTAGPVEAVLAAREHPIVAAFFGGAGGWRQLAGLALRDYVRREDAGAGLPSIDAGESLQAALSAMILLKCDRLAVTERGAIIGTVSLTQMVEG